MADIASTIAQMQADGSFRRVATNVLAQFGTPDQALLGATLLPERLTTENAFRELSLTHRVTIANDMARYAPPPLKAGPLRFADFRVELGDQGIGAEMTAREYEALREYFRLNVGMPGMGQLLNWADAALNRPLVNRVELQRWQAIVAAQVTRQGDNGYAETVPLDNPTGHRVTAGGTWSSNAYDPYRDIAAAAEFLAAKGRRVTRMITTTAVRSKLASNSNIAVRAGGTSTPTVSSSPVLINRPTYEGLDAFLGQDRLPRLETYDAVYHTQTATFRYLPEGTFVLASTRVADGSYDFGLAAEFLPEVGTLGYAAIGTPAGQNAPGRALRVEFMDRLPPRVEGEASQTSFPVLLDSQGIMVINGIS